MTHDLLRTLAANLERQYPQNALSNILEGQCGNRSPSGAVCTRPRGHGVTAMRLPNGRRTYVDHNVQPDGTGEGWG